MIKQTLFLFFLALPLGVSSDINAQQQKISEDSPLFKKARHLAQIGGSAKYCMEDIDLVDEYIIKSQDILFKLAQDNYEKTFVNIEFKNLLTAFSVKKPELSCKVISLKIKEILR